MWQCCSRHGKLCSHTRRQLFKKSSNYNVHGSMSIWRRFRTFLKSYLKKNYYLFSCSWSPGLIARSADSLPDILTIKVLSDPCLALIKKKIILVQAIKRERTYDFKAKKK